MRTCIVAALLCASCVTSSGGAVLSPREKAMVALQKGDTAQAVVLFDALHAEAPADLDIARGWAEAHVKNGTSAGVMTQLGTADTAVAHYVRGLLLFANAKEAGGGAVLAFRKAVE